MRGRFHIARTLRAGHPAGPAIRSACRMARCLARPARGWWGVGGRALPPHRRALRDTHKLNALATPNLPHTQPKKKKNIQRPNARSASASTAAALTGFAQGVSLDEGAMRAAKPLTSTDGG
jgi:hypothetical protein